MSSFYYLAAIFFISLCGSAQVYHLEDRFKDHLEMNDLKGKVKSVRMTQYMLKHPSNDTVTFTKERQYYIDTFYNENGNITVSKSYRNNNSMSREELYSYDANQRLVLNIGRYPDVKGSELETTFTYDAQGNLIKEEGVMPLYHKTISTKTMTYNEHNQMIEMVIYYDMDGVKDIRKYRYDDLNRKIEAVSGDAKGNNTTTITYYPQSNLVAQRVSTFYNGDTIVSDYMYNDHQNIINYKSVTTGTYSSTEDKRVTYKYDAQGSWIMSSSFYKSVDGAQYDMYFVQEREIVYY